MARHVGLVSVAARDCDEAIAFHVGVLGFTLIEDKSVPEENERWIVLARPGAEESRLLLARAASPEKLARAGNQAGGRVFLFLHTGDFERDFSNHKSGGCRVRA